MSSITGVSPGAMNGLLGGVYKPQAEEVTSRLISPVTMQVMGRNDGALIRAASKHFRHWDKTFIGIDNGFKPIRIGGGYCDPCNSKNCEMLEIVT